MGFKNVKTHYQIVHSVTGDPDKGLCIGSPYVHDLLRVAPDGTVTWGNLGPSSSNDDLTRYYAEMTADRARLVKLLTAPDTFSKSITVYTYDGATIIEKQCEEPGWPNVTHDGELMFDNSHSTDKRKVVRWAKENADAALSLVTDRIAELRESLKEREETLEKWTKIRADLEAEFPKIVVRKE